MMRQILALFALFASASAFVPAGTATGKFIGVVLQDSVGGVLGIVICPHKGRRSVEVVLPEDATASSPTAAYTRPHPANLSTAVFYEYSFSHVSHHDVPLLCFFIQPSALPRPLR
jgi:hypothetical protein